MVQFYYRLICHFCWGIFEGKFGKILLIFGLLDKGVLEYYCGIYFSCQDLASCLVLTWRLKSYNYKYAWKLMSVV